MELDKVYEIILDRVATINKSGPIRIAINGIEGTGKTIFADRLTQYCNRKNFHAIHVSIDGFHYNKAHRHKKGNDSAIGYYEDAYDEQTFINKVLRASQNEFPTYIPSSHDLNTDKYLDIEPISISSSTILITDGSYLFKPVYRAYWDLKIYLKTDFEMAMTRGIRRDAGQFGLELAKAKFINRYHAASIIYIAGNQPESLADIIIDNTDFENLILVKS